MVSNILKLAQSLSLLATIAASGCGGDSNPEGATPTVVTLAPLRRRDS